MFNKLALGVVLGITTRTMMEFYTRLKEVDDFGRMSIATATEFIAKGQGTVAQHERLTALSIAQIHAAADAAQLKQASKGMQQIDLNDPRDAAKLKALLEGRENGTVQTGQYL